MQLSVKNALITLTDTEDLTTKGKHFKSRFILPGLAGYPGQFGNALIKKENLDRFVHTLRNKPVTIKHKDNITDIDKKGEVFNVWYNPEDGWYWCDGIITDPEAVNLINSGWSVSCAYDYTACDNTGGTLNNIPYDIEFLDGEFNHLALVDNPRYEGANIVFNSKVDNEDKWITIKPNGEDAKGKHLLLKDGETPKEAIERTYGKKVQKDEKKIQDYKKQIHEKYKSLETKEEKKAYIDYLDKQTIEFDKDVNYKEAVKWLKDTDTSDIFGKELKKDKKDKDWAKAEDTDITKEAKELQKANEEFYGKQPDKEQKQSETKEEDEIERLIESADSVSMFDSGSIEKRLNDKAIKELNNLAISEEKKQETLKQLKELHKEILKKLANAPSQYKVGLAEFNKRVGFKKSGDNLDKAYSLQAQRDNIIKQLEEEIRKEKTKQENISLGEKAKDAISKGLMEFEHKGKIWFRTSKRSKSYIGLDKYSQSKYDKMKAQNSLTDTILNAISDMIQGK